MNHRNDPQPTMSQPIPKHEKEVVWPVLVEPGSLATELDLVGDAILNQCRRMKSFYLKPTVQTESASAWFFSCTGYIILDSAGAKTCFFWGRVKHHCGENWKESSTVGRPSTTSNTHSNPGSSSRFLASSSEALKLLLGQLLINEIPSGTYESLRIMG